VKCLRRILINICLLPSGSSTVEQRACRKGDTWIGTETNQAARGSERSSNRPVLQFDCAAIGGKGICGMPVVA
jgi:hypothetical protein